MSRSLRMLVHRLRPRPRAQAVPVSDEGVALIDSDGHRAGSFNWDEVRQVVTFKRDLGIHDDIRLGFRLDDRWVEVSEDVEGWSALSTAVRAHFPTIPPDWYETVMLPPFETCYRVLYERG